MKDEITFDALSPSEFEELAYDLLVAMGFQNVNWRKGTGCETSPSDQGRDIECTHLSRVPDGSIELERWFVECKHHKRGVPPDALAGALAWSQAERPARLLFVISNFLSNPAKEHIQAYERSNKPPFRIQVWELPKLKELLGIHTQLRRKYGLLGEFPLLSILHPSHVRYLKMPPMNSLAYFFDLLDDLSPSDRHDCLSWSMHKVINPAFREAPPGFKGTLGDLMIGKVDYSSFKEKCHGFARAVMPGFVVSAVVNDTLQYLLHMGDPTSMGRVLQNIDETISRFRQRIAAGDAQAEVMQGCITLLEKNRETTPDTVKRYYSLYTLFCERIVGALFDEDIPIKMPKAWSHPTP
jgi:hypothetical protein